MIIIYNRGFEKALLKMPKKIQTAFKERVSLFIISPYERVLNNHRLNGRLMNYKSINITGDYRLIFEEIDTNTVRLIDIGTHSELYGK